MKLSEFNLNNSRIENFNDVEITGISYNSKTTKAGDVFICQKGEHVDSHNFFQNAIENGAVAFLCERKIDCNLPQIIVDNSSKQIGELASIFFGYPTKDLNLIGVTGTNGKTTVSHLMQQISEEDNKKCAIIGTLGYKLSSDDLYKNEDRTTPQPSDLQQTFSEIKNKEVANVIMEVSSHALSQNRIGGSDFKGAIFTNLTQDHLDYHKTMEEYFKAKAILFKNLSSDNFAVINIDDVYGNKLCDLTTAKTFTYGIYKKADFRSTDVKHSLNGASFLLNEKYPVNLKMCGEFSVYNTLAAIAGASAMGIDIETAISALEKTYGVAGRFEAVVQNPLVIVDYAHTPDGLENVLNSAKEITPQGSKLICVFGCGGDRDTAKRPIMAQIAERIADVVIITSDNPRSEDPQAIIDDVLCGISNKEKAIVKIDRHEAIIAAKNIAEKNDVIILAGKGHEDYQILKTGKIHFSDKECAKEIFS
ncbi:MAG: UDP-N-acetylmuramoyl-L-alanyl-D-glutamate--2,6-diaminopimelate ligase [Alphaproteobacteria bacterium]